MKKLFLLNSENEYLAGFCNASLKDLCIVQICTTLDKLSENVKEKEIDLILLDFAIIENFGFDYLEEVLAKSNGVKVVILSNVSSPVLVVKAIQLGVVDFIQLPCAESWFFKKIQNILSSINSAKTKAENFKPPIEEIIGESELMKKLKDDISVYAKSELPILIHGETGTGKSFIAEEIHKLSARKNEIFYHINCAAVPESLAEAEFFGSTEYAFTGASNRAGYFEIANHGTFFLDEIGEMNLGIQSKLLSVLDTKKFYKVGSTKEIEVDIRFLFATNVDLKQSMTEKKFRRDLFHRISALELYVPPLRDRKEDIPLLANMFLRKTTKSFTNLAMEKMINHTWKGNIRELENVIQRAIVLSPENLISEESIKFSSLI